MLATHVRHRSRCLLHSVEFGFPGTTAWTRDVAVNDVDAEQAHPTSLTGERGELRHDPFAAPAFATRIDGSAPRFSPWS